MTNTNNTNTNPNPTYRDVILANMIETRNDCLAAAERAENYTYEFEWRLQAKKWDARIADHIAADARFPH